MMLVVMKLFDNHRVKAAELTQALIQGAMDTLLQGQMEVLLDHFQEPIIEYSLIEQELQQ